MKRREFLTAIGGAAMSPLPVWAQEPKNVPRIGFLATGSVELPETRAILDAFYQGLREHGYIDGQNLTRFELVTFAFGGQRDRLK
jgi:hypothetical protein